MPICRSQFYFILHLRYTHAYTHKHGNVVSLIKCETCVNESHTSSEVVVDLIDCNEMQQMYGKNSWREREG